MVNSNSVLIRLGDRLVDLGFTIPLGKLLTAAPLEGEYYIECLLECLLVFGDLILYPRISSHDRHRKVCELLQRLGFLLQEFCDSLYKLFLPNFAAIAPINFYVKFCWHLFFMTFIKFPKEERTNSRAKKGFEKYMTFAFVEIWLRN